MPNEESQGKSLTQDGPPSPHIQHVSVTVGLQSSELNFPELMERLKTKGGTSIRFDNQGVRGALQGRQDWGDAHAHFSVEQRPDGDYVLELDLTTKAHGGFGND